MTRRLLASYLGIVVLVLVVLEIPLGLSYARNQRHDLTRKLERDASTLATLAETAVEHRPGISKPTLARYVRDYQRTTGGRVVIVDSDGTAVVDSSSTSAQSRDFTSRPEIQAALRGEVATGARYSQTLQSTLAFVAVPIAAGGLVHGAVRITYPQETVDDRVLRFWLVLLIIGVIILLAASVLGLSLARSITRPLHELESAAAAAEAGDFDARAPTSSGPPEIRGLSRRFNTLVAKVDALLRAQEEFVADAAHQLRTPLTALRLRLENLEGEVSPQAEARVAGAIRELDRLSSLVEGLLRLASADHETSSPVSVALASAVEERMSAWSAVAAEREVTLVQAVDEHLMARTTPGRVEQVLDNLLANAIEVSPRGSFVRIAGSTNADTVELHVIDQGPGMSDEERARAFDRLWRARDGGYGLGLAIVDRLVRSDGGDIELASAPGGGLDAVVRLRPAQ